MSNNVYLNKNIKYLAPTSIILDELSQNKNIDSLRCYKYINTNNQPKLEAVLGVYGDLFNLWSNLRSQIAIEVFDLNYLGSNSGELPNRLGCQLALLNFKKEFIELTGDIHNMYINNISKIFTTNTTGAREYLNSCISRLNDNKLSVISYLSQLNMLDAYNGSMSDIERLGYLLCAYLKDAAANDSSL